VVVRQITDLDRETSGAHVDGEVGGPLLVVMGRIRAEWSTVRLPQREILLTCGESDRRERMGEPLKVGDGVLVVVVDVGRSKQWICGRLQPCDKQPKEQFMAIETFRPSDFP
jgi:hypothetical protein